MVKKTAPLKRKPRKKVDTNVVEKLTEKYLPTKGLVFDKESVKTKEGYDIRYIVKGDASLLKFLEYRLYDGVSMISDAITFEIVPISSNDFSQSLIVVKNDMKFPFIKDMFAYMYMQIPTIECKLMMNNTLVIKISFVQKILDASDIHLLWAVEYILNSAVENFENIKKMLELSERVVMGEEMIDESLTNDEKEFVSDPHFLLSREDYSRMEKCEEEYE